MKKTLFIFLVVILPALSVQGEEGDTSLNFGFDIGVGRLLFAHQDFRTNFKDASRSLELRSAVNLTYGKFRLEHGAVYRSLRKGEPDLSSYKGRELADISTKMEVWQKELLLLFVKYEDHRVSFIGGGPVVLEVGEVLDLDYTDDTQEKVTGNITGSGYKLTVGGKNRDSILKMALSYTSVRVRSLAGNSFNLGGYSMNIHLSFGAP
jgi:hypothetical protein